MDVSTKFEINSMNGWSRNVHKLLNKAKARKDDNPAGGNVMLGECHDGCLHQAVDQTSSDAVKHSPNATYKKVGWPRH